MGRTSRVLAAAGGLSVLEFDTGLRRADVAVILYLQMDPSVRDVGRRPLLLGDRLHLAHQDGVDNGRRNEGEDKGDQVGNCCGIFSAQQEGPEQEQAEDKYHEKPQRLFYLGDRKVAGHAAGLAVHGEEEVLPLPAGAQEPYREDRVLGLLIDDLLPVIAGGDTGIAGDSPPQGFLRRRAGPLIGALAALLAADIVFVGQVTRHIGEGP